MMYKPYLKTFLFFCLIAGLSALLYPMIGYRAVGFIFLLGVMVVGLVESHGPALFAAFLSALAWNFLFIPPRFTFVIGHPDDVILCLTYFVAALITGVLTSQIRRHQGAEKLHQTLLNSISHELRTPLTAIMGAATALGDEKAPNTTEFRVELARELTSATDRLNRVIENLLDMSRLNSGVISLKKEWHDIHDLVGVAIKRLGKNLQSHKVVLGLGNDLPLINIDFRLMEHVLSNVILNAVQYSPKGSAIIISSLAEDQTIQIMIDDHGPGITPGQLAKIFDKFYRLPGTPAGGTGLGLSIAKNIVELHDGVIFAENRVDGGARFVIRLPRGKAPELPKEKDAAGIVD